MLEFASAAYGTVLLQKVTRVWVLLQVEQMAIGAIGAWILFKNKKPVLEFIYQPAVFYTSCFAVMSLFIVPVHHWWIHYAEAIVFAILIMNLSTNPKISLSFENKLLNTLGNISYGIYMYHALCITFCLFTLRYFGLDKVDYVFFNILLYTSSIVMTITASYASYEMFEKRILSLKEKFMVVKSGAR
jgi:peptidoglycan/LPS O-acetylase OafA/YrhL